MTERVFAVHIGYQNYMIDPTDAVILLQIVSKMQRLKQQSYGEPYTLDDDQTPIIDTISTVEVNFTKPEEPDPYMAATNAVRGDF